MPALPIQRLQAGQQSFGRRASGADFGGAEADAAAQRGGAVAGIGQPIAQGLLYAQQLKDAADQAKLSRKAAEYAAGLDEVRLGLEMDTDLDTHEERLQKAGDDLLKKAREDVPPELHGEFEDRVYSTRARARLDVVRNVLGKRASQGRADTLQAVDVLADVAGRAGDGRDREAVRSQALTALDVAMAGGLIDQSGYDAAAEQFDRRMTEALARAGKNASPQATLAALEARRGGFERMGEPERQEWIEKLTNEVQQRETIAKAERAEAEARVKQAESDMQREAEERGYFAAADGLMTTDWVKENRDRLSRGAIKYFLGVAEKAEAAGATDAGEIFRLESLRYKNPKAFAAEKIDPAKVGPKKAVELLRAQAEAKKADFVPTGRSFNGRVVDRLSSMSGLDDDERSQLFRVMESEQQAFAKEKGDRLTPDEEQSVIDEVLLRRVNKKGRALGFIPFTGGTAVLPADLPLELPGVPTEHLDGIVGALKRAGKPITPQSISDMYEKAKAAGMVK